MTEAEERAGMEILNIKGVSKDFRGLRALNDVTIDVGQNEILGLIGPNGSGKTTLVNIITGFLQATAGQVIFKGESITGLRPQMIARKGIARTFQLASLFPNLTLEENVIIGNHIKTAGSTLGSFFYTRGYRNEEVRLKQKAEELLATMGMKGQAEMLVKSLSFGDQRKAEIAIALATEPALIILDEPAAGMNLQEQAKMVELLKSVRQMGMTIIVIEHKMRVIMGLCSKIVVLDHGVVIAKGTPAEVCRDDNVISAYLGKYEVCL